MTLEEAIKHLDRSLADSKKWEGCTECRKEHEQLKAWLTELKQYKDIRWIPVEEQLPDENGLYVVAIMGMGIAGPIYMRDLTDYENESGWYAKNVVAWWPCKLPKPYRSDN